MTNTYASSIPSHVPSNLVKRVPFSFGKWTNEVPFDRIFPEIHQGPELIYVPEFAAGGIGAWIPRRLEDMRSVYQDTAHFTNEGTTPFPIFTNGTWRVLPLESDPPLHSAYRSFLNPLFSPKLTKTMDSKIRRYAREYVARFNPLGSINFVEEFALEFPVKIFLELMGLPQDESKKFVDWTSLVLHSPSVELLISSTNDVIDYLRDQIEDRRKNPKDDLVTKCVQARLDGKRPMTDDEVLGFCFNLFVGGLDTVGTNMVWQIFHLARHIDHQRQLRAQPDLIPDAIEEFMRAYASVMTFRVCVKEVTIRGVQIMPGDKVVLSTTLAGRDPKAFDRPNEIILDRKPRHISFGFGPHFCVGMHLARREMRIALEEFLAGIPEFRLKSNVVMNTSLHGIVQPDQLILEWNF